MLDKKSYQLLNIDTTRRGMLSPRVKVKFKFADDHTQGKTSTEKANLSFNLCSNSVPSSATVINKLSLKDLDDIYEGKLLSSC